MKDALLTGLLRCERDGGPLSEYLLDDRRAYVCFARRPGGCTHIDADDLDRFIAARVLAMYTSPTFIARMRARAETTASEVGPTTPRELAELFTTADLDQRRAVIGALLVSATIRPADDGKPLEGRVDLTWR